MIPAFRVLPPCSTVIALGCTLYNVFLVRANLRLRYFSEYPHSYAPNRVCHYDHHRVLWPELSEAVAATRQDHVS